MLCTQQWLQESLNSAIQRSPQWRTQLELKKAKREVKHTENPRLLRNILKEPVSPEMSPISSHCPCRRAQTSQFFYWNASHQNHQHSTAPACTLLWVCGTQKLLWVGDPLGVWDTPAEEKRGLHRHRAPEPPQLLGTSTDCSYEEQSAAAGDFFGHRNVFMAFSAFPELSSTGAATDESLQPGFSAQ